MPDERVPHDEHMVFQAKVHIGIGRAEIVAVRAFPRMNGLPFQVVLRGDLVELLLCQSDVFVDLLRSPIAERRRFAGGNGAIDGHADIKVTFVGVLEGGRLADCAAAPVARRTAVSKPRGKPRLERESFIRVIV